MASKRKQLGKSARFEIFKRDGFACQYCGATPPAVVLEIDHIVAVSEGGSSELDNLLTACQDCNRGKAARPLSSVPPSLKEQAHAVAEREAQLRGYHEVLEARRTRLEEEQWRIAEALEGRDQESYPRRDLLSIRHFLERLPFHEVLEAADLALARVPRSASRRFRYFCAICWNKIKGGR